MVAAQTASAQFKRLGIAIPRTEDERNRAAREWNAKTGTTSIMAAIAIATEAWKENPERRDG